MSANVLRPCYEFNKISDRCRVKIGSVLPNRTNIVDFVVINTNFCVDKDNRLRHSSTFPLRQ